MSELNIIELNDKHPLFKLKSNTNHSYRILINENIIIQMAHINSERKTQDSYYEN